MLNNSKKNNVTSSTILLEFFGTFLFSYFLFIYSNSKVSMFFQVISAFIKIKETKMGRFSTFMLPSFCI